MIPTRLSRFFGNLDAPLWREFGGAGSSAFNAALASHHNGVRVFPLFLWRRWPVLDLTRRNIDDHLGELGGIAGALFHSGYFYEVAQVEQNGGK